MLTAGVVTGLEELGPFVDAWDELAVAQAEPFGAPAWALAWWRHLRPDRAELRVVLVEDGEDLVGVVPLYAVGAFYHPLGTDAGVAEIVARPGSEAEVARTAAAALVGAGPRPVSIELQAQSCGPDWSTLFEQGWPTGRGAWSRLQAEIPVPWVDLGDGGFEQWLNEKSGSFRRDIRRNQRKLERDDGSFRLATAETLERDVAEFLRLHRERREGIGGTSLVGDQIERTLLAAGSELLPRDRFRLYCLEMGGRTIAAQLVLAAGSVSAAWNSGFDEDYSRYAPSIQCIAHALADAVERGERGFSLGSGGQDYKSRMATREESVRSRLLVPRGSTYPVDRLRVQARQARRGLLTRLRRAGGAAVRSARRA